MEGDKLKEMLKRVASGEISIDEAMLKIKTEPFEDLGFAKVDYHRGVRQGVPEIIYGEGKTAEQIIKIASNMVEHGQKTVLITRLDRRAADIIKE